MADSSTTDPTSGEVAPATSRMAKLPRKKDSTAQLAMGVGIVALAACLVAMALSFLMTAG